MAEPDREVRHEPGSCSGCGAGLAGRPVTGVERRQVFDLPPVMVKVTEHQLIERECGCGHRTRGAAPEGAQAPVRYGPRVAAVIITSSDVAGFDETGFRVEGRLHGVHCARTGKYTLLMVHPRRGRQAMEPSRRPVARYAGSPRALSPHI